MNEQRKSDRLMVPTKSPNATTAAQLRDDGTPYTGTKVETPDTDKGKPTVAELYGSVEAEAMEERGLAEGNTGGQNASRTQSRTDAHRALDRVREAAKKDKKAKFTALLHH